MKRSMIRTSKKGIIFDSPITSKKYRVFKWKDLGDGKIEAIEKYEIKEGCIEIKLLEVKKFFYRRFKHHDRIYFITPTDKLHMTSDLNCFIHDMKKRDVRDHLLANAIRLRGKERINWRLLE